MAYYVGWVILSVFIIAVIAFSLAVVKHFIDLHDQSFLTSLVATLSLSTSILCVLVIPVDVYVVSYSKDSEVHARSEEVKHLYYALWILLLAFTFIISPFAYFYFEEDDGEETPTSTKVVNALKYTICFTIIVAIFIVVGLFIQPHSGASEDWEKALLDSQNSGDHSITFTVACLAALGLFSWFTYTASGLCDVPIGMIRSRPSLPVEQERVTTELQVTREKARSIQSKYALSGRSMSRKDKRDLDLFQKKERLLSKKVGRLDQSQRSGWEKIASKLAPARFVVGCVLLVVTLLLVVSYFLTTLDRTMNSCGLDCGFVLSKSKILNPFDEVMLALSKAFPVDLILLSFLVMYIFLVTLNGIIRHGIRLLCIRLWSISPRRTCPQAFLLLTIFMAFVILVLSVSMVSFAPQYSTYGSQTYPNEEKDDVRCQIDVPKSALAQGRCQMTQIAQFYNRIVLGRHFWAVIFFYSQWIFLGFIGIWMLVAIARRTRSTVNDGIEGSEDEDDF